MSDSGPGYADQSKKRMTARVVGVVCMAIAVILIGVAITDMLTAFNSDEFGAQPTKTWMFFAALPFFLIGGVSLNAGFMGAGVKYAAGEIAPTARDARSYLGVDGATAAVSCAACGARNAESSTFCDDCGSPLRRLCDSCKHPNASDAKFCAACGTSLASA
jgi:hypothetical protein